MLPVDEEAEGVVPPVVPAVVPPVVVAPVVLVPLEAEEPAVDAFVRMNFASLELVLPVVPVAPEVALGDSR